MKLGILSDSHDNVPAIETAVARLKEARVDFLIHAGDFVAPFALPPLREVGPPVIAVLGNNDGERVGLKARFDEYGWQLAPKFACPTLNDVRIAVHHEPEPVEALAASGLYQVVIYGHTHEMDIRDVDNGTLIINPGEVGGWLTGKHSLVVLDLERLEPTLVTF